MVQCCDITTASLNTLIYIERRLRTPDGLGGWIESWSADPAGGVWAKVQNTSGTERYEAQRVESLNLVNFFVRFRGATPPLYNWPEDALSWAYVESGDAPYWLATETRVRVRGRYYNVLAISDLELQKKWLRLFCQEGDPA